MCGYLVRGSFQSSHFLQRALVVLTEYVCTTGIVGRWLPDDVRYGTQLSPHSGSCAQAMHSIVPGPFPPGECDLKRLAKQDYRL